jgi:hypothetical protein
VEHRSVANSKSSCNIGRIEDGLNFLTRQMPHERLIMPFTRDGVDLTRLCQGGGNAELDIPNKGFNCSESSVARGRAIASLFLDVSEEVENQRRVDLLETDLGGLDPKALAGKDEQEPKGVSIGLARVRAAPLLDRHVFA